MKKVNKNKKIRIFLVFGILIVFFMCFISAEYIRSGVQYMSPGTNLGGGSSAQTMCGDVGQDFIIQIAPFGCSPAVVRSDLLEEQNVPVFCQLAATKINPLIDVEAIDSISFSGQYPKEVSGIGFQPAQAALGELGGKLNSPVLNNIGYAVIVLKQQKNASAMPDYVEGTLTADIKYDIQNAFGIGKASFYLPLLNDDKWEESKKQYGFWNGKAYLKVDRIGENEATVSLYDGVRKISGVNLEKGKSSDTIYIPGFDCLAGLKLRLEGLVNPATRAKFNVNGDIVEVAKGDTFLDNKCSILNIDKKGLYKKVDLRCDTDEKRGNSFSLIISPKVKLNINGEEGEYELGDKLPYGEREKNVYIGYIGTSKNSEKENDIYVRFLQAPPETGDKLSNADLSDIAKYDSFFKVEKGSVVKRASVGIIKYFAESIAMDWNYLVDGEYYKVLSFGNEKDIFGKQIEILGFAGPQNAELKDAEGNYVSAEKDYDEILRKYSNEINEGEEEFGESTLYNKILLAKATEQKRTMVELCDEFKESYSNSKKDVGFCEGYRLSSSEISIRDIVINSRLKTISFEGVYEPNIDDYSVKLRINKEDVDLGLNDVFYMGDFGTGVGSEGGNWKIDRGPDEIKTILKKTSGYSDCIKYIDDVSAAGKKYEIDPLLLFALMKHESNCNSDASNTNKDKKGNPISLNMDIGLMQVNTKAHCGEKRDGEELSSDFRNCVGELYDKTRNIYVGADILKTSYLATKNGKEYNVCGRNILYSGWEAALRGYNGWGCYPGQGYYVEDVTKLFNDLGGGFSASTITGDQGSEYIKLTELTENYAKFDIHVKESEVKETVWKTDAMTLDLNQFKTVGNYNFRLIDINLKKFAQVSVIPSIDYAGTKANFSFRLGIEQRTFKLTPEKTKEKISVLDKSISDFESTTEELGKFVKTMNRACVVTGTGLMLKNLVNNAGGKAIARKQVMRSEGGWYQTCADLVSKGTYKNVDVCLADNSDAIEKHVERYYNDMKLQEQECADIQDKYTKKGVLGQRTVDDEAYLKECIAKTKLSVLNNLETMFPNGVPYEGGMISAQQFVNTINENTTTIEEWRDLSLNSRFNNDEGLLSNMAKKSAQSSINDIYKTSSLIKETEDAKVNIDANSNLKNVGLTVVSLQNTQIFPYEGGEVVVSNFGNISVDSKIQKVLYEGNVYTLKLNEFETNKYRVEEVYNEDGSTIPLVASREILSRRDKIKQTLVFEKVDASRYENKYLNPVVRYFETEPYKGEPALVPVDVKNGWYVVMKQTLPVLGNIQTYDASGIPRSFYLCNVGKNGNEENRKYPDDECGLINFGTGQPVDEFSGLSKEKASALVSEARKAIEDAQKAHKSGARSVSIKGQTIEVGEPMADIPDIQCQDTMSASDCKLLFNVCDPVVCPSSRCNLGGKYNVENVIQSGITGGIFLCAPNFIGFGGDVVIPVCLSGIHAGLDGWVQIQKSYRDCLQDSLDTGQMTGICDEIYSLHGCEFLWRQGIPAAKLIIPKFLEVITGQNVKGGGEYLGMQTALKNAGDSVSYFTNYYAKNSFAAFKARSTEEVGSVFCKNFISGTFPNFDSVMDVLTEPVSPVQFHGRFEEILYTTATNPPMSQYKVWYFIYAGKDSGSYYQVYLTGAPETSYYQDTGLKKIIASGYLSAGERIDEAPDLLATSGYQQLCIRVNEQEECGFKQVSTEFGVTYVKDLYMKEQASQENIKTEKNCIAGTASLYSLASPSGEGAADELLNPSIYNRGIIRICATNNPGKSTDANWQDPEKSRWKDVGYCDDNTMRCWLDKKSVENVIENQAFEDEVLEKHAQNQLDILINQGGYFSGSEFTQAVTKLKELENKKSYSEIISSVNSIFERAFLNNQKAKLLFLRGNAFAELAKGLFKGVVDEKVGVAGIGSSSTQAGREMDGFDEQIVKGGPGCCNYKTASMKESVCSVERSSCDSVQAMWIEEGGCIENNKKCVSREEFAAAQKCSDVCDGLLNTCDINECHEQDGYGLNCFFVDSLSDTCVDCDNLAFCSQLSDDNEKCLDSRCGGKLGCVWESNGCVKKGWEVVQVNVKLTLEKAIEETKTRKGKYSENKDFVDQLYNISILTEEEYVEINGKGFWDVFNVEEDMNYLLKILLLKLATQRKAEIDQSFLDIENELEYDLEVQNINEFVEIRYVLNQTSTFPDLYFGYYEKTSPLRWVWTIDSGLEKWFAVSTIDEMLNNPQKNNQLKYLLGDVNSKTDLIRSLQGKDYDSGKILVLNAGGKGL